MPNAYYIEDHSHSISLEHLSKLGVIYFKFDADNYEQEGKLGKIRTDRGYNYVDFVDSRKIPNLKEKLVTFHEEHIHDDEEIRFFLDGSGYFDVRDGLDEQERWVRVECQKGDMLVLVCILRSSAADYSKPAGIYHRFVPDDKLFFSVMRLFCGEPIWTPYNRTNDGTDLRIARQKYVDTFLNGRQGIKRTEGEKKETDGHV